MASSLTSLISFFLVLLPLLSTAQSGGRIGLNSSLFTHYENSWTSPSGDFAFGFRSIPGSSLFVLAIWFAKLPEKTIVWSGNRDEPVPSGSRVELANDGRLLLRNPQGTQLSEVGNAANGRISHAAMLDTGNFVLVGEDGQYGWESFDRPTDTLLPSQTFPRGGVLTSSLSETNYSTGRFRFRLLSDGNLVMNTINLQTTEDYGAYYASDTIGSGNRVVFNTSGYLFFEQENRTVMNLTKGSMMVSTDSFYQRATLDPDGVFRQYVRLKAPRSDGSWPGDWSTVGLMPANICQDVPLLDVGSGPCGFNSYCVLDEKGKATCKCPPGFSPIDGNNTGAGCGQDFTDDACSLTADSGKEQIGFRIEEILGVNWPSNGDYGRLSPMSEDQCRQEFLADCLAWVVIYHDGTCWKKKLPLANGKTGPQEGAKALFKLPVRTDSSAPDLLPQGVHGRNKKEERFILIGSPLLGASALLNFIFLSIILFALRYSGRKKRLLKDAGDGAAFGVNLRSFTYRELEEATHGFKEELGRGAFGTVYKGILQLGGSSRASVAVKKLDRVMKEGEKEFEAEVEAVGRTHHKNLVQLLGFCHEKEDRVLVYEYMSNGSLAELLFGEEKPSWSQRTQIALGIARGLMYLHEECGTQIIHCDIKPQNVLLDDSLTARISDFGLSKLLQVDQTQTRTGIRGTKGYVAPEWFRNMAITAKVDVYSFGVLLLEIVACRKNLEVRGEREEEAVILTDWAYECYVQGDLKTLAGGEEDAMDDRLKLQRFVKVAIWCIQEDPTLRPTMKKVIQMLEGAIWVPLPPDPFPSFSINSLY